jgi:hypothetical protein
MKLKIAFRLFLGLLIMLLGAVGTAYFIGSTLPKQHSFQCTSIYKAPQDKVWLLLTDINKLPEWNNDVSAVTHTPTPPPIPGEKHGSERWDIMLKGGVFGFTIDTTVISPTRYQMHLSNSFPLVAHWEINLITQGEETLVILNQEGMIHNPFMRFLAERVIRYQRVAGRYLHLLSDALDVPEQIRCETAE